MYIHTIIGKTIHKASHFTDKTKHIENKETCNQPEQNKVQTAVTLVQGRMFLIFTRKPKIMIELK